MKPNNFPLRPNLNGSEEIYTQTNDVYEKFTLEAVKNYLEASEWTEVVINVSSAQILSMGSSPIQLLPKAGDSKYYIFEGVLEFIGTGTPYSVSAKKIRIYYDQSFNGAGCYFNKKFIESKGSSVIPFNSINNVGTDGIQNGINFNSPIFLSTDDVSNPTSGTGTIRIVLRYKVKTFGA